MGQAALTIVNALSCQDWARYVCNAMHFHSKCGEECCEMDITTEEVSIASSSSSSSFWEPRCL